MRIYKFIENMTDQTLQSLGEFIIDKQEDFKYSSGELSRLLSSIKIASKIVNREVNKAGIADILGKAGNENIQGEEQMKLDVFANEIFIEALSHREIVCGIASEENENFIEIKGGENNKMNNYVVLIDPLDGSSNVDVNVSVGTIFSIYRRTSPEGTPVKIEDFLQKGENQVAAGYVIYGSSTMLVYSTGKYCQKEEGDRPYTSRYIGSLVADFHRNMIKGGIYIYPPTSAAPKGKLRLLYECNPIAFLTEQAGGKASDGYRRILEIEPTELHQRVPFFCGSSEMVEKAEEFMSANKI